MTETTSAPVEFLDALPPIHSETRGPRPLSPEVQTFLDALKANPGKWAKFPIERKTKPELPEGFKSARRDGVLYAQFEVAEVEAPAAAENDTVDLTESVSPDYAQAGV